MYITTDRQTFYLSMSVRPAEHTPSWRAPEAGNRASCPYAEPAALPSFVCATFFQLAQSQHWADSHPCQKQRYMHKNIK